MHAAHVTYGTHLWHGTDVAALGLLALKADVHGAITCHLEAEAAGAEHEAQQRAVQAVGGGDEGCVPPGRVVHHGALQRRTAQGGATA